MERLFGLMGEPETEGSSGDSESGPFSGEREERRNRSCVSGFSDVVGLPYVE